MAISKLALSVKGSCNCRIAVSFAKASSRGDVVRRTSLFQPISVQHFLPTRNARHGHSHRQFRSAGKVAQKQLSRGNSSDRSIENKTTCIVKTNPNYF